MKLWSRILVLVVMVVLAVPLWLLATGSGLELLLRIGSAYVPGTFEFRSASGRVLGPINIEGIRYQDPQGVVTTVQQLNVDWIPTLLFSGVLQIRSLVVSDVAVATKTSHNSSTANRQAASSSPPDVHMPLTIKLEHMRVERLAVDEFKIQSISGRGSLAGDHLVVPQLDLRLEGLQVNANARLQLAGRYPASITSEYLASPPGYRTITGRAKLEGDVSLIRVDLSADNVLELSGEVEDLLIKPRWRARLRANRWTPSAWRSEWPQGQLDGTFSAQGGLDKAALVGGFELSNTAAGDWQTELDASWDAQVITVKKLTARPATAPGRIDLTGAVDLAAGPAGDLNLQWAELEHEFWPVTRGELKLKGNLQRASVELKAEAGDGGGEASQPILLNAEAQDLGGDRPRIRFDASAPSFAYETVQLDGLKAQGLIDMSDRDRSNVQIELEKLRVSDQELVAVSLEGSGTTTNHALTGRFAYRKVSVTTQLSGAYQGQRWDGKLENLSLEGKAVGGWRIDAPVPVQISPARMELGHTCLRSVRSKEQACFSANWQTDALWHAAIDLSDVALGPWIKLAEPQIDWEGNLAGEIRLSGDSVVRDGNIKLQSPCCVVRASQNGETFTTLYRDLDLNLTLQADKAQGSAKATLPGYGIIEAALELGGTSEQPWVERPVDARAKLELSTLQPLQPFVQQLRLEKGAASLDLRATGSLSQPRVNGSLEITDAQIQVPSVGVGLEALQIMVRSKDGDRLELKSTAQAGNGSLRAEGVMRWSGLNDWQGKFSINGKAIDALRLPEAQIIASPEIEIVVEPARLDIQGKVSIDEATINLKQVTTSSVVLSPDVVVVHEDQSTSQDIPIRLFAKIRTELGDKTTFGGFGVSGRLRGALEVIQESGKATAATGEIQIVDGSYKVYGQKLQIETGRLIFAGGNIEEPGLDIRAVRKVNDVAAGVTVRGTAVEPTIQLFSKPAMSDSEVLSYLLLGRPPTAKHSQQDTALLIAAANSMLPGGGNKVTDKIKSTFGLEELSLESTEQENGQALVIGKYLSPDIYISYAAGLAEAASTFRIRYQLSKHWLLQTESSDRQSGGEILYTIDR